MSPVSAAESEDRQRWLARAAVLFVCVALVLLLAFAAERDLYLMLVTLVGVVVIVASTYGVLAHRGALRVVAAALLVATPLAVIWLFVRDGLLWVVAGVGLAVALALVTGRAALAEPGEEGGMPEHPAPRPRRPFVLMNPRSGGGKVGRFGLKEKAEALGAEVVLLEGADVDVTALAREAVARGADLLGVAGGDGTQALVAGVAAELDVTFLVISAGTRNHFALDLGLDREDPTTCLAALGDDAVELHVDLGTIAGRTFVNNASFGAYAAVVQNPSYRDDKRHTTLDTLPELLTGHTGPRLTATFDGVTVEHPQAVLVSDNPYGLGDVAGLGRRARIDTGMLGVVAVTVDNAGQAVRLLGRRSDRGVTVRAVPEVVVSADAPEIPVGIDGESVLLSTPVRCTIRPKALRVRVPRDRPGVPRPRAKWDFAGIVELATSRRSQDRA